MKTIKLNIKMLSFVAALFMAFTMVACDDDDNLGQVDAASLESIITEAEALIQNNEEGTSPGAYKPGSKKELQDVITWVNWKVANAESQDDVSDAAIKLQVYIDKFKANIVTLAVPIIGQSDKTFIQISDNIKSEFTKSFTIETKIYVIDLAVLNYANNVFATEQDGPDRGFVIRYFNDGAINLNVGTADGWKDVKTAPGVIKAGEWMHIAFVNEITSQKLYINGVEVLSQTQTYVPADASFVIGNGPTWTNRAVNAMMKDVRVWSSARSTAQIAENLDATFENTEADLAMYFPFDADLGTEFKDNTGKYSCEFKGDVTWAANGIAPEIKLEKKNLVTAIKSLETLKTEVVEGDVIGNYPVGTKVYLQALIDEATAFKLTVKRQADIEDFAKSINTKIEIINTMLVGDADGILIDRDAPGVGFRITPNYSPQGDYTIEFNVKVKSLSGYKNADLFNNGENGIWIFGYEDVSEENILNSGGLSNFSHDHDDADWNHTKTEPLVMKIDIWQHVAIVHDNTAKTTKLFVDGVLEAMDEDRGSLKESGWGEMWLGNGWGKMDGYMKDFRLWDIVRDPADLDADIEGTEAGLHIYFPLDRVKGVKFPAETGDYQGDMKGISWNVK